MIRTPFDQPADIPEWKCWVCGKLMHNVKHYWVLDRWLHPTIHDACSDVYERQLALKQEAPPPDREIPERFRDFDERKADKGVMQTLAQFLPDSKLKTLAIVGVRSRGKSRMMWACVQQFFDVLQEETGARRWPEYYLFSDLISELDRQKLNELKAARFAFVDDIGSVESFGRERAALQAVLRARIQKGDKWTFLTIDSLKFDEGLEDLLRGRSLTIYLDK